MTTIERGVPLVERIIERTRPRRGVHGCAGTALDALESRLMVELPGTLRRFLEFDFTFASFGARWQGRERFGKSARTPRPRVSSVRKLAEAMADLGFTSARLRRRVVRLPNLPGQPWNCLYLGEPRAGDGELPILGLVAEDTHVAVFVRYTAFDLYLAEQSGLTQLGEGARLDDLESHLASNTELRALGSDEESDAYG
jgi:hypothetical protein